MVVFLRLRAGKKLGFSPGIGIERAQHGPAIGVAHVTEIEVAVVKESARIVVPGPGAVSRQDRPAAQRGGQTVKARMTAGNLQSDQRT